MGRLRDVALRFADRMRRQQKIALAAGAAASVLVIVIAGLVFGAIVRSAAEERAERRGLRLEIGTVWPGWGRVWLEDVRVTALDIPAANVRLDSVEVDLTFGLGVERVVGHGGSVRLDGSAETLRKQVEAFAKRRSKTESGGGAVSMEYAVEGLHVVWFDGTERPQRLWGARYARSGDGREELGADRAELRWRNVELRIDGPALTLERRQGRRVLDRLAAKAVEARLDVDLGRLVGTLAAARQDGDAAVATALAGLVTNEDSPAPPRAAKQAPKRGAVDSPDAAKRRGPELRAAFARLAKQLESALPEGAELDLGGLRVEVGHGDDRLGLGPGRLHIRRDRERVHVSFAPGKTAAGRSPLMLELEVPLAEGVVRARIAGGPLSLAALGAREGELGLMSVERARVEARGEAVLAADGSSVSFAGHGRVYDLALSHKALSEQPVRGLSLAWRGRASMALDGSKLVVDESILDVGKVRLNLAGEMERQGEELSVRLAAGVPLAPCEDLMASLPSGLAPLLTDVALAGTFALDVRVEFDSRRPAAALAHFGMANDCRVTAAPTHILPKRFFGPFTRVVDGADGAPIRVDTGPGTPDWVPHGGISPHMSTAIVICEDGRFFRHRGFDAEAIENSIKDNLKAGRFLRGASTVSMQLAKNLYLSRDKTLARKLQEAVLTMLLEQELSKEEIVELYLNIIEYGPGLYGIGPAARYYFATTADQLTLGQSLYLASILPNPRHQHFGSDGSVSEGWMNYLHKLMHIAHKIRRVDDQQLEEALAETITFRVPGRPSLLPGDEIVRDDAIYGASAEP